MQNINVSISQKKQEISADIKNVVAYNPAKGTKEITENGKFNIKDFEFVNVEVLSSNAQEKQVKYIENGNYEILPDEFKTLSKVSVEVEVPIPPEYINPSGVLNITTNGNYNVREKNEVNVNVPIPEGFLKPQGTLNIDVNGEYNVSEFEKVNVNTPTPQGTLEITSNGEYDVSTYEKANVNISNQDYLDFLNGTFGDTYYAPEGANQIKGYSFYNNQNIIGLVCSSTIKGLGTWCCRDAKKLKNVSLNYGLEIIGIYAFYNCTSLEEIVIPETVTEIGNYAFNGCTNLNKVNIPNGVKTIQNYCFASCPNLKELTIPPSVTQMNNYSLTFGSNGDATLIVEADNPPTVTSLAIGSGIGKIIVPKNRLNAYKTATNWSAKADIMEEEQ